MTTTATTGTGTTRTTSAASDRRSPEDVARGFIGSVGLAEKLQRVLVDLIELHLQGKQAHWNVVGPNFRDLHLQLDEIVDVAREASDTIAERMRALSATPDGRSDVVAATTTLPEFPAGEQSTAAVVRAMVARLNATAATLRTVHDDVDAEDPTSADLLHQILTDLEKQAWMLGAEVRTS